MGIKAATIAAASASRSDVASAISSASDGDIVTIPAGTADWNTVLDITKAITLQGAGMDSTIIRDQITSGPLITWTLVGNKNSRMTGIGFQDNGRGAIAYNGVVYVSGGYDSRRMRIDNCRFVNLNGVSIFTGDTLGVIDSCHFVNGAAKIFVYVYHENWGGYTFSDGSFADPPGFGQETWLFIENNSFAYTNGTFYAVTDAYRGARYAARYNTVTNAWWEAHGTDSGGRRRGTRAMEIYMNTHYYNAGSVNDYFVNFRSATGVIWSNTLSGYASTPKIQLAAYRLQGHFQPFGYADGESRWDTNSSSNPFVSGTASSGGTLTMTDSGKSWTTDQWAGYSLVNVTSNRASIITANTATTLTFLDAGAGGSYGNMAFAAGNSYRINLVVEVMDQPGKGQGTRLLGKTITSQTHSGGTVTCTVSSHGYSTGDYVGISETESSGTSLNGTFQITVTDANNFTYSVSGSSTISFAGFATKVPAGWPDQVDEPIYEWNNTHEGNNVGFTIGSSQIRATEHYVSDTQYPAYTPYTYPHPLRGVGSGTRGIPLRGIRLHP